MLLVVSDLAFMASHTLVDCLRTFSNVFVAKAATWETINNFGFGIEVSSYFQCDIV